MTWELGKANLWISLPLPVQWNVQMPSVRWIALQVYLYTAHVVKIIKTLTPTNQWIMSIHIPAFICVRAVTTCQPATASRRYLSSKSCSHKYNRWRNTDGNLCLPANLNAPYTRQTDRQTWISLLQSQKYTLSRRSYTSAYLQIVYCCNSEGTTSRSTGLSFQFISGQQRPRFKIIMK